MDTTTATAIAVSQCIEANRDDIEANARFMTDCIRGVHDHSATFQHLFVVELVDAGRLGSFRAGCSPANPEQCYDFLVGCCVTCGPRDVNTILGKDVTKFITEGDHGILDDIINLYKVCKKPQWVHKQKLVIIRITKTESGEVHVCMVSEEYFVALVKALVAHLTDGCDYLGTPFALCTKIYDMFNELSQGIAGDAYVLYFYTKKFNRLRHHAEAVQLLHMMYGRITKLVTLPPTLVAALKGFAPSDSGASKPRKAAAAAHAEVVADRGSINSCLARQYGLLVIKPEAMTRPGLYLELARAAADGSGFAMRNPMREVWRAIGAARVRSLVEERVPIKDLPDLTELYKSLVLQYCPKADNAVELSRCVQLLRELCLAELGLFDVCFTEFARIDALIESYVAVYRRPRLVWDGYLPSSEEFAEMVRGVIDAPALPPLTDADARPAFVAEDWIRFLGVILQHVYKGNSLDTVHRALAVLSDPFLRVVPSGTMKAVSYFALDPDYYEVVLDGVIRAMQMSGPYAVYHSIPMYLQATQCIPVQYELFKDLGCEESESMELADEPSGGRRPARERRPVDRFRAEPGSSKDTAGTAAGPISAEGQEEATTADPLPMQAFDEEDVWGGDWMGE